MKGKKSYPVACKTKDTVESAARAGRNAGGRCVGKEIGALPGDASSKHAGKASRSVHGKPLMSSADALVGGRKS